MAQDDDDQHGPSAREPSAGRRWPAAAEDRLVRDMLNSGGYRVWVQNDVEEWRDNQQFLRELRRSWLAGGREDAEFLRELRELWMTGGREDAEFARDRRLARESRTTLSGRLFWVILPAILTIIGGVLIAGLTNSLHLWRS